MLIKSDLESPPHSCFTSCFILETPQSSPYYHNLPGKTESELCCVWGRKQKYVSLWSWEKLSLAIQGGFCVPKVSIREKLYGMFFHIDNLAVSREQRTENTFRNSRFENIFRIHRTHQRLAFEFIKHGFTRQE